MSITTEDGVVLGLKPTVNYFKNAFTGEAAAQWHNLGLVTGLPGVLTFGTPGLGGAAVSANALGGALRFDNPTTGLSAYLARLQAVMGANIAQLMLFDLLWYNSGLVETTTTAQTLNSAALPARDVGGTINGDGVEAWLLATTTTGNAGAINNTTFSYTNEANAAGRSAGLVYDFPATALGGTMVPFGLQGSDRGVRSIQTLTFGTSYVSGQVDAIMIRPVCKIPVNGIFDWAQLALPRLFDSSALYLAAFLSGTAAGATSGDLSFSHG